MLNRLSKFVSFAALALVLVGSCWAQDGKKGSKSAKPPGMDLFGGLGNSLSSVPYDYKASFEVEEGGQRGRVKVELTMDSGHHTFSTTQPPGGPAATVISLKTPGVTLAGPFTPDSSFEVSNNEAGFEGLRVELHHDAVTWTAPVTFSPPLSTTPSSLLVHVDAQVCKEACIPVRDVELQAEFVGFYPALTAQAQSGPFQEPESPVSWTVKLSKSQVRSGDTLDLVIRATPDPEYHIYKYDPVDTSTDSRTLLVMTQKAGLTVRAPETKNEVVHKDLGGGVIVDFYEGEVEWRIPMVVPAQAIDGIYPIQGLIGYQGCTMGSCDQPRGIRFQAELTVSSQSSDEPRATVLTAIPFKEVAAHPNLNKWIDAERIRLTLSANEIFAKFCLAMLGGLILNFMPCVLPVIGLKILGFVSEAGGDRGKSATLTLTYAAGIISLVLILGLATVLVRMQTGEAFGWGQQFGDIKFRILITAFMFSLALSFLGVWEIPIPGFAMSKASTELSNREGYVGAFCKGIITTLLATPCSAPFLGGVFVVALSQPAWVVLLIFGGVGVGMSLPYLLVAAKPSLLSFLPKPGPWMEVFKEVLAFPMLLSVVFLVSGFLDEDRMAMLSALMFVWFGCWMVGRVPAWAESRVKWRNWSVASIVTLLGVWGSFYYLQPSQYKLAWQPYEETKLDSLVASGKTVMIDFTANWCQNCKLNLRTALETKKVKELIDSEKIIPMVADLTNYPPEIKAKLKELNSLSIPVLAIYSGGNFEEPLVLRDLLTESQVLEALKSSLPVKKNDSLPTSTSTTQAIPLQ